MSINHESWIQLAEANDLSLTFEEELAVQPVRFEEAFRDFLHRLTITWNSQMPDLQLWLHGGEVGCVLISQSDGAANRVTLALPELLPPLVHALDARRMHVVAVGDLPETPGCLFVGSMDVNGAFMLGWMEILKDEEGNETLGLWTPLAPDQREYEMFSLSWLATILQDRHNARAPAVRSFMSGLLN